MLRSTFTAGCCVITSLLLALLPLTPASANNQPSDCSQDGFAQEPEPLKACEEKLHTAHGRVLTALDTLVGTLEATPGLNLDMLTITNAATGEENSVRERLDQLRAEQGRHEELLAETENEDFEQMIAQGGKQRKENCRTWREVPGIADADPNDYLPAGWTYEGPSGGKDFGDGDCNSFSALSPEGLSKKFNERSLPNVCERVCEDADVPGDFLAGKVKKKDRIRGRHIARRSEAIESTEDLADQIENAAFEIQEINLQVADRLLTTSDDKCAQSGPDPEVVGLFVTKGVIKILQHVAGTVAWGGDLAHDVCEPPANQDAVGFNAASSCLVTALIKGVAAAVPALLGVVVEGIDMALEGLSIWAPNDTLPCVSQVGSDITTRLAAMEAQLMAELADVKRELGEAQAVLAEVLTTVDENREYIRNTRTIVLTPHGQRKVLPLYERPGGQ